MPLIPIKIEALRDWLDEFRTFVYGDRSARLRQAEVDAWEELDAQMRPAVEAERLQARMLTGLPSPHADETVEISTTFYRPAAVSLTRAGELLAFEESGKRLIEELEVTIQGLRKELHEARTEAESQQKQRRQADATAVQLQETLQRIVAALPMEFFLEPGTHRLRDAVEIVQELVRRVAAPPTGTVVGPLPVMPLLACPCCRQLEGHAPGCLRDPRSDDPPKTLTGGGCLAESLPQRQQDAQDAIPGEARDAQSDDRDQQQPESQLSADRGSARRQGGLGTFTVAGIDLAEPGVPRADLRPYQWPGCLKPEAHEHLRDESSL